MPLGNFRRRFIAGFVLTSLPLAGCLSELSGRSSAESVSGQIANETSSRQTITVKLKTPNGKFDLNKSYTLAPSPEDGFRREFRVENSANKYVILAEVESGLSESYEWNVNSCSNHVRVLIEKGRIDISTSNC